MQKRYTLWIALLLLALSAIYATWLVTMRQITKTGTARLGNQTVALAHDGEWIWPSDICEARGGLDVMMGPYGNPGLTCFHFSSENIWLCKKAQDPTLAIDGQNQLVLVIAPDSNWGRYVLAHNPKTAMVTAIGQEFERRWTKFQQLIMLFWCLILAACVIVTFSAYHLGFPGFFSPAEKQHQLPRF